jgi:hypothetical protein
MNRSNAVSTPSTPADSITTTVACGAAAFRHPAVEDIDGDQMVEQASQRRRGSPGLSGEAPHRRPGASRQLS